MIKSFGKRSGSSDPFRRRGPEDYSDRRNKVSRGARRFNTKHLLLAGALMLICGLPFAMAELGLKQPDVKKLVAEERQEDWAVPEGFSISIDPQGYHYPTAIAFVPDPGDDPKDPLYFVTELRGKV
jgi:hypothetical protein